MIDEYNKALKDYWQKWQALVEARKNKAFFERLKPTAVCFKVEDLAELDERVAALRDQADHIHWGWINQRWLVTLHLRSNSLAQGIKIIKLYQRRQGSTDPVGLDHLDFYASKLDDAVLKQEPKLKWSHESNGPHCAWTSLWFDGTEAKLRTNTTIDVVVSELTQIDHKIIT